MLADIISPVTKNSLLMKKSTIDNSEQKLSTVDNPCGQSDKETSFVSLLSGMDKEALLQSEPDEADLSALKDFIQNIDSKKDKDQKAEGQKDKDQPVLNNGQCQINPEQIPDNIIYRDELLNNKVDTQETADGSHEQPLNALLKEPVAEAVEKPAVNALLKEPVAEAVEKPAVNALFKESVAEAVEKSVKKPEEPLNGKDSLHDLNSASYKDSGGESVNGGVNEAAIKVAPVKSNEQSTADLKMKDAGSIIYDFSNKKAVSNNLNDNSGTEKNEAEIADKVFLDDKQEDKLSYVKRLSSKENQSILISEKHDVKKIGINFNVHMDKNTDSSESKKTEVLKTGENIIKDSEKIDSDTSAYVKAELYAPKEKIKIETNNSLKILDGELINKNMESKGGNNDLNENKFSLHSGQEFDNIGEVKTVENKAEPFNRVLESKISEQIIEKVNLNIKNGKKEIKIKLKPEFLGRISMKISTDNQQIMVKVMAEHLHVKELIENNLNHLKTALNQHGLDVDKFDVFLAQDSGQSFDEYENNLFNKYEDGTDADLVDNSDPDEFENEKISPDLSMGNGLINYFA